MLSNWKTTVAGLVAAVATLAVHAYQPGMTAKQWLFAILQSASIGAAGILAKDHDQKV